MSEIDPATFEVVKNALYAAAEEMKVVLAKTAYSPLLKGIYNDPDSRSRFYNWELFNTEDSRVRYETRRSTAAELGVTGNQLVLAWMLHHSPTVIPLLGARTWEQFREGIVAADIRLAPEIMARLNGAQA